MTVRDHALDAANHARFIDYLRKAGRALNLSAYMNATELYLPGKPDEVSLLFATREELEDFRVWAIDKGLVNFARVESDVCFLTKSDWREVVNSELVTPMDTEAFVVRFEFLKFPGAEWRIEAMCVLGGTAPLHEAWLDMYGSGCVVHVSYKCASRADYDQHCATGPQASVWAEQPTHRASYANGYGRFAYYQHDNFSGPGLDWLLKPRVNERDAG
jgi:hypothetical protein